MAPYGEVICILRGEQEHHISADVAWAVGFCRKVTGDENLFAHAGAEILFETARFWKSRVERGKDGLLDIRHVMGSDEYHEDVDDIAYTNGMVRWNLEAAAWGQAPERLYTGWNPRTGLFEQFRSYIGLELGEARCPAGPFR